MKVINKIRWDKIGDIEDKAKNEYLEEVGQVILQRIHDREPVRTGNLLNHTYLEAKEGHLIFHADTPYAEAVDARVHFMEEVEFADYEGMLSEMVRRDTDD